MLDRIKNLMEDFYLTTDAASMFLWNSFVKRKTSNEPYRSVGHKYTKLERYAEKMGDKQFVSRI